MANISYVSHIEKLALSIIEFKENFLRFTVRNGVFYFFRIIFGEFLKRLAIWASILYIFKFKIFF